MIVTVIFSWSPMLILRFCSELFCSLGRQNASPVGHTNPCCHSHSYRTHCRNQQCALQPELLLRRYCVSWRLHPSLEHFVWHFDCGTYNSYALRCLLCGMVQRRSSGCCWRKRRQRRCMGGSHGSASCHAAVPSGSHGLRHHPITWNAAARSCCRRPLSLRALVRHCHIIALGLACRGRCCGSAAMERRWTMPKGWSGRLMEHALKLSKADNFSFFINQQNGISSVR